MLLHDARRDARFAAGAVVLLDDQDRSLWDREQIQRGRVELERYHHLHAARAELLRRLGRIEESRAAYEQALSLVHSDPERAFLERRRGELLSP